MFSKYATLLAFTASAIAGAVQPGIYQLTNVASQSTARTYQSNITVYVSREVAGPFDLWNIRDAGNGAYTLENVGLRTFADVFFDHGGSGNAVVQTYTDAGSPFSIEPAGDGQFVIRYRRSDLLWNVEPPVIPYGNINISLPDGRATQRWILTRAIWPISEAGQDDYDERWELLQRVGRFLGQFRV